ncbi:hypothetical protein TTHT_0439 [Thermotomaculum hydrothermale]|uniref:Tetratricopeptide TPR_1 repeat-containing protein n=1 Tax=Thermotomaculum hydrothermale TaxID=981385 RepID=A0A7R6PG88_9BACT|nr:tetratricopeptide repeat protein [Thermotomaculum hydrothermale]BBB32034.1 hypothetical protein TTHT_0439 [Thermotomaculum hydrothermale]
MKNRDLILIILFAVLIFIVAFLYYENVELLRQNFTVFGHFFFKLQTILLVIFLLGGIVTFAIYRSFRLSSNLSWRANRFFVRALNNLYSSRYEEAREEILKALDISPKNYDLLMTAGVIEKRLKNYDKAYEYFLIAFKRKPTIQAFQKMIDAIKAGNLKVDSEELYYLSKEIPKPDRGFGRKLLLDYFKEKKEWEWAYKVFNRGKKYRPDIYTDKLRVEIEYEIAKKEKSKKKLKEIIKEFPDFAPAYMFYAKLLQEEGKFDEMVEILKNGYYKTHIVEFLQMIEDYFLEKSDPEGAVETLNEIVLNENYNVLAQFFLGKLYYRLELLEKAREIFENIKGEVRYIPGLYYYLADIYRKRSDFDTAFAYLKQLAKEQHLDKFRFKCENCGWEMEKWSERCPKCGEINSVRIMYEAYTSDSSIFML